MASIFRLPANTNLLVRMAELPLCPHREGACWRCGETEPVLIICEAQEVGSSRPQCHRCTWGFIMERIAAQEFEEQRLVQEKKFAAMFRGRRP